MLLSEARTLVRTLLDDLEEERWSDAQIDQSLRLGHYQAASLASRYAPDVCREELSASTNASGALDLSGTPFFRILSVSVSSGSDRLVCRGVSAAQATSLYRSVTPLVIGMVAQPDFPAGPTAPFAWGGGAQSTAMDHFVAAYAAGQLQITEGTDSQGLARLKAELTDTLKALQGAPGFSCYPIRSQQLRSSVAWCLTSIGTLQLVRP